MAAGFLARTSTSLMRPRTLTAGTGVGITNSTGDTGNPTISVDDTARPRCSAYGTAQQDIVTGTFTAATLDAEDYDVGSMHDNATNNSRITVTIPGLYLLTGGAQFVNNAVGQRVAVPKLNGTTFMAGGMRFPVNSATGTSNALVSTCWNFVLNDYVELFLFQDTGGNLLTGANVAGASTRFSANFLQLTLLRAA